MKRFIAKRGYTVEPDRNDSVASLSVTLPRHSPTPEENGEPDNVSQSVDKGDDPKVLKPRRNAQVLKVHDDKQGSENK